MKLISYKIPAFIISIFFLLNAFNTKAQKKDGGDGGSSFMPTTPNIFPPSPTAAEFAKYGEIPVSYYTGTPNINIPLYTVSLGQLSLPISLSYHSSGIKVEEIAPWTGYGWSLNAGGIITRSVVGLPDDQAMFGIIQDCSCTNEEQYGFFQDIFLENVDTEHDKFYYNFLGYSGSFIIVDGEVVMTPEFHKIRITPIYSNGQIIKFNIITKDGTKFYFGENETEREKTETRIRGLYGDVGSSKIYYSSWHLSKIMSVDNTDIINFSYTPGCRGLQEINKSASMRYLNDIEYNNSEPVDCGCSVGSLDLYIGIGNISKIFTYEKYLSEISTENVTINFTTSEREDYSSGAEGQLTYCKKLKNILISSDKSELIKGYDFNYYNTEDRLFLTEVKNIVVKNNEILETKKPSYVFEYFNKEYLPKRSSSNQDHWGYYNNAGNSNYQGHTGFFLIPYHPEYNDGPSSAERSSSEASLFGMLKKVSYPTGGYSEFEFGTHKIPFSEYKDDYYEFSKGPDTHQLVLHTDNISILNAPTNGDICNNDVSCDFTTAPKGLVYNCDWMKSIYFYTTNNFQNFSIDITVDTRNMKLVSDSYVKIYIYETSIGGGGSATTKNQTLIEKKEFGPADNEQKYTYDQTNLNLKKNKKYYIIAEVCRANEVNVDLTYYTEKVGVGSEIIIGGARIEKIITNDGKSSKNEITIFDYTDSESSNTSSGKLASFPDYKYNTSTAVWDYNNPLSLLGLCNWSVMQHSSLVPLGATGGSHIGYSRVKILDGENAENGYTINTYENDTTDIYRLEYPFAPISKSVERGKLLKSEIYDKNKHKISQIEYVYTNDNTHNQQITNSKVYNSISNVSTRNRYNILCTLGFSPYGCQKYTHETHWYYLSKTIETKYDYNNNELKTITEYKYDNPAHAQLSRTIKKDKFNNTLYSIENTYPLDIYNKNNNPVLNYMNEKHIINPVIEKIKKVNNKVVEAIYNNYTFNVDNNYVFNEQIYRYTGSEDFEPLIVNHDNIDIDDSYEPYVKLKKDEFGNIIEYCKENDLPTSIIWGYNNTYPVAIIEGQAYTIELSTLSASIQGITDDIEMRSTLNVLRLDYPNAKITTNTYEPLKGVTSETDPNGKTIYYEYDDLGRLKLIKDQNRNIIKTFDYNYKQKY